MKFLGIFLISLTLSIAQTLAWVYKAPKVIDSEVVSSENIKSIAQEVCSGSQEKQISRISSIIKLVDYFDNLSQTADEELADCGQRYNNSLHDLRDVIKASEDNVCSDEKLSLIEDFHHKYISTVAQDVSNRETNPDTSVILKLFFMNYAMEVSDICKKSLINNLEWDLKDKFSEDDYKFGGDTCLDMITKAFTRLFKPVDSVKDYDDVLLVNDLIQSSIFSMNSAEIADEGLNPENGEPVRLLIKAKNVKQIKMMQEKCHYKFKPIYEKLILPIVRLSDIGYTYNGQQFQKELEELRENKMVKRWYSITQLCELILPIQFFQDESLGSKETVLITKEEAEQLSSLKQTEKIDSERAQTKIEYAPTTNSIKGLDKLETVENSEVQITIKHLKSNLSSRDRAINRALVRIAQNLKQSGELKLSFSHKETCKRLADDFSSCSNNYVKEDMGKMVHSLADMSEDDLLMLEGSAPRVRGIVRNKGRQRKGPDPIKVNNYQEQLYMHTKSWSQIFDEWHTFLLDNFTPKRRYILIFGVLVALTLSFTLTAFAAAG